MFNNSLQTPGAGAWEAFRRGYRMGLMASTDNHVGMPGRSYPGDRQIHTGDDILSPPLSIPPR